jgi:hypothetical protein
MGGATASTNETSAVSRNIEFSPLSTTQDEPSVPSVARLKQKCRWIGCLLLLLATVLLILGGAWTVSSLRGTDNEDLIDAFRPIDTINRTTCPTTLIYPFRVGCPQRCERATHDDEPMYRMSMAWYLGDPTQPEGAAYDRGFNYQCPLPLVANFQAVTRALQQVIPTATNGLYVGT